jgi:predicted SAM-dependent methyltransferase
VLGKATSRARRLVKRVIRRLGYHVYRVPPETTDRSAAGASRGLRVCVGCGEDARQGYLACDVRPQPNVAIVCKAWELSQHCSELQAIYSRDMLERLTFSELERTLRDWLSALRVGGQIELVVPNLDWHIEQWRRASWSETAWADPASDARYSAAGFWGGQRDEAEGLAQTSGETSPYWDVHKSGFGAASLRFFLERAGFDEVFCEVKQGKHLVARATKTMDASERQIAPSLEGIRIDHRARYELAARRIRPGERVLDVACGVGYGTYLLASTSPATAVTGMDLSAEAIAYATKHFATERTAFQAGDVLQASFEPGSFEAVVCLETLEHVVDDRGLLSRLHAWLVSGGLLVCSTPNQDVMAFDPAVFPFHVRHYTGEAFATLLAACGFAVAERWSQPDNRSSQLIEGWTGMFNIAVCRKR